MSIGINWAEVWGPVWGAVWRQAAVVPPADAPSSGGGWPVPARRRSKLVEQEQIQAEQIEAIENEISTARTLAMRQADRQTELLIEGLAIKARLERQRQEEEDLLLILASL